MSEGFVRGVKIFQESLRGMKFSVKFVRGLKFSQECSSPPTFKKKGVWKFSGNSPQKVDVCVRKIRFLSKKFPDWAEQTYFLKILYATNQQQITLFEEHLKAAQNDVKVRGPSSEGEC